MNLERLERSQARVTFTLPAKEVDNLLTKTAKKVSQQIKISGFRPGRAPVKMVEAKVGKDALRGEAISDLLPQAFSEAIQEHELNFLGQPHFEYQSEDLDWGQEFSLAFTLDLLPEVELGTYKGVVMEKRIPPLDEELVQKQIEAYRKHFSELIPSERTVVEAGDQAKVNFKSFDVDNPEEPLAQMDAVPMEVGSGFLEEELDQGIVGMEIGEEKTIRIEYPEDFRDPNFAGKTVDYQIELLEINERSLPELTDEFVKEVSGHETLAAWEAFLKEELAKNLAKEAEEKLKQDLIDKVVAESTTDLPPFALEEQEKQTKRNMEMMLAYQGFTWEDYENELAATGESSQEVIAEAAAKGLKTELVLDAIAKAEELEPTAEELAAEVERLSQDHPNQDEYELLMQTRQQLRLNLARKLIREEAQVEEVQEEKRGEEDEHTDTNGGGAE